MPTTKSQQDHYRRNADRYKRQAKIGKQRVLNAMRKIKTENPCKDCGQFFPAECMDFDHRGEAKKIANVSKLALSGTLQKMLTEIKKCDLVCANCHRIRTAHRMRQRGKEVQAELVQGAVMDLFRWAAD